MCAMKVLHKVVLHGTTTGPLETDSFRSFPLAENIIGVFMFGNP
jgi:hypothetical protein